MKQLPKLIAFDLDDTLAPSKSPAPKKILELLLQFLEKTEVAVISGGNFEQFSEQLIKPLSDLAARENLGLDAEELLQRLYLLPTCGTRFYRWQNSKWSPIYEENLSFAERANAAQVLEREARNLGLWAALTWGEVIEDRGSQITFSALGQRAPIEAKEAWDPDGSKRKALTAAVRDHLPDLEVRSGGSTSVDVTRKGIDKAYGMKKLAAETGINLKDMFFVGDRLDPDGNDYPVKELGVPTHSVTGWEETASFLEGLLHKS